MKIYSLKYFANHYSNGGNWTHILEIYEEESGNSVCKLEDDRATDVKRKVVGFISGNNLMCLSTAMKYREDFYCSLLLSNKDVEYLKSNPEMNTYYPRNADKLLTP
jgi:hypothetical protein